MPALLERIFSTPAGLAYPIAVADRLMISTLV
jgi:hypothetical protein